MTRWYRIISRIVISAVLAVLISLLFIERQYAYRGELVTSKPFHPSNQTDYMDLDGDGRTEHIRSIVKVKDLSEILIYEWDGDLITQINVEGSLIKWANLQMGDYNRDGLCELYLFASVGDSLFLNVLDPYSEERKLLARKYIPGCSLLNGEAAYKVTAGHFSDMNGDSLQEFYFSVIAGFTLYPRNVYAYDLAGDTLFTSPGAGTGPRDVLLADDLDGDGTMEFWGKVSAYGNHGDNSVPYSDMSAWLMVFSHELDFEFEPIEFPGFGSVVDARIMDSGEGKVLVAIRNYKGNQDSIHHEICLVDPGGRILSRERLPVDIRPGNPVFYVRSGFIHVCSRRGSLYVYNDRLELKEEITRDWFDCEEAGKCSFPKHPEALYYLLRDGFIWFTDPEHRVLAKLDLKVEPSYLRRFQNVSNLEIPEGFHMATTSIEQTLSIEKNPRQYFIYLYGFAIFLSILTFMYLVQLFQIRQERRRQEEEKKLRILQLQSLKSQMNPHFIFNALNSISAMYMQGYSKKADRFLTRFSRMIREVVDSSDRVVVSLREELDFVKNYLELEKIRYGDNFTFNFNVPVDLMDVELPSMCVHAFAENSVKHAFPHKEKSMHIEISARKQGKETVLSIRDNGIGFGNAEEVSGRTGRGMQIVSEIISNYSRASGRKIYYTYQNIPGEDQGLGGSLVELYLGK